MFEAFQAELIALGYPQGDGVTAFNMSVISNGSECANPQPCGSGGNIFTWKGKAQPALWADIAGVGNAYTITAGSVSTFAFPALFHLGSLPGRNQFNVDFRVNAKANGLANEVYRGKITYTKKKLSINFSTVLTNKSYNAQAATLAFDHFPGGFQDFGNESPLKDLPSQASGFFLTNNILFTHQGACHIPVPSALDIGQGAVPLVFADYFTQYTGNNPPTAPNATPFNNFITAINGSPDNEQHTQITRRNGDWLADKLQGGTTASPNCDFLCNPPPIAGDDNFCTTSNPYTIANLPVGVTVTWTASPGGAVTINAPNASQTTLTKLAGGEVTLTATVSSVCGSNVVNQRNIIAGAALANIIGAFDPTYHTIMGEVCVDDPYYFVAGDPVSPNPSNTYTWTHFPPPGSPNSISLFSGSNLNITFIEPGMHTLRVNKSSPCGDAITNRVIEVLECFNFMFYSISPNPASSTINIGVNTKNITQNRKVEPSSLNIDEVKIYDATGFLRLQQKVNKQQSVTINTSALTNGLYRVEISHAGKIERQQLLINR